MNQPHSNQLLATIFTDALLYTRWLESYVTTALSSYDVGVRHVQVTDDNHVELGVMYLPQVRLTRGSKVLARYGVSTRSKRVYAEHIASLSFPSSGKPGTQELSEVLRLHAERFQTRRR